ncbi:hypothetical protein [Cyanobium sp. WAJ14-Wanaka]|uniref:hypothetical protein n=1 Tax=Cyanobium sp. WAJ14-Wanaka TaxID=2823725 RepID=UPI0020CDED13|nr:hypothetical protein [Cyanobium sp. WAJ14-Wanaka]MCP9775247.1 hypothetical protein [Cyanobium sp. WAJ14-Wanaka]
MTSKNWLISGVLVLLCGGVLVAFTDIEVRAVRWVSCGPLSTAQEDKSELCN